MKKKQFQLSKISGLTIKFKRLFISIWLAGLAKMCSTIVCSCDLCLLRTRCHCVSSLLCRCFVSVMRTVCVSATK